MALLPRTASGEPLTDHIGGLSYNIPIDEQASCPVDDPRESDTLITVLLQKVQAGQPEAIDQLFEVVYQQLRRMARRAMAGERSDHTLQPTALVNEAYVALFRSGGIEWQNREHFFAQMARTMRHKLVDHAKRRKSQKHRHVKESLDASMADTGSDQVELLVLDEALTQLGQLDPDLERIVELRFYGGLTEAEVAHHLGYSSRTVKRRWAAARALMLSFLTEGPRNRLFDGP